VLVCVLIFGIRTAAKALDVTPSSIEWTWDWSPSGNLDRARVLESLERTGGRHLVIVHYEPNHYLHCEWVQNDADIDNADVVWARDMGEAGNRELVDYFRDRQVWPSNPT
jgi:hypothetical protein